MEIVNQSTPLEVSFNDYANLYWDNQLTMLKQAEAQENEKVREGFKKYRKATKEVVEKAIANCQKELDELFLLAQYSVLYPRMPLCDSRLV